MTGRIDPRKIGKSIRPCPDIHQNAAIDTQGEMPVNIANRYLFWEIKKTANIDIVSALMSRNEPLMIGNNPNTGKNTIKQ